MFNLGLKLWSINKNYVKEAIRLYEQGIYEYIELFIVPGSLHEYVSLWKNLGIPYVLHGPHFKFNFNFSLEDNFNTNQGMVAEALQYADKLRASRIIFHPGIGGDIQETARQIKILSDPRMLIENKPYYIPDGLVCVGATPEEIDFLKKETGIGFCFDLGHAVCAANALKKERMGFIGSFLQLQPSMFHATDGDWRGIYDRHEHLGTGSFPFKKIFTHYPNDAHITLETYHDYEDKLDDFVGDVKYVRAWEMNG